MIYTFIADISRLDTEAALKFQEKKEEKEYSFFDNKIKKFADGIYKEPSLGKEVLEHISAASDEGVRHERLGAYILLSSVMKNMFGGMPKIFRTQNGKPYFDRELGVYFGISHSDELVAVSISIERAVGVDVEKEIDVQRAARLEQRFFSEISIADKQTEVSYTFAEMFETGKCKFYSMKKSDSCFLSKECVRTEPVGYHESFSAKWTLYEATLKCDGGGFTSLPCLGMLLLETKSDSIKLSLHGNNYYVSSVESR